MADSQEKVTKKTTKKKKYNTNLIPAFITLLAASITCIFGLVQRASFETFVTRLLVVVIIFLVFSTIVKMVLDYSFAVMDEKNDAEGEGSESESAEEAPLENISALMADDEDEEE